MTVLEIALVAAIVAGAGILRGFSGFGSAMVLTPLLGTLMPLAQAVPLIVILEVALSFQLLPAAVKQIEGREILAMSLAAVPGLMIGAWLLQHVEQRSLRVLVSFGILTFVLLMILNMRRSGPKTMWGLCTTGCLSGITNGAAGIGGPPVVLYYLAGADNSASIRATVICYFFIIDLVSVVLYAFHGLINQDLLVLTLLCTPAAIIGVWLGTRLFTQSSELHYRRVAYAIIMVAAILGLLV